MEQRFRPRPPIFIGHTVVKNTNKRKSPGFNDDITTERGSLVILQFLKLLLLWKLAKVVELEKLMDRLLQSACILTNCTICRWKIIRGIFANDKTILKKVRLDKRYYYIQCAFLFFWKTCKCWKRKYWESYDIYSCVIYHVYIFKQKPISRSKSYILYLHIVESNGERVTIINYQELLFIIEQRE